MANKKHEQLSTAKAQNTICRALLENISEPILLINAQGKILEASQGFWLLLGQLPSANFSTAKGKNQILPVEQTALFQEFHKNQLTSPNNTAVCRLVFLSQDRSSRQIEVRCFYQQKEEGDHEGVYGYLFKDLGEQHRLNELEATIEQRVRQLPHKQNIMELIYNNIGKGITLIDKDFCILKANRYIAQLLGKKPEDLIGHKCYEIFGHEQGQRCTFCPAESTLKADIPISFARKILSYEGKEIYLENVTFPILDKDENLTGFIYFSEDISLNVQLQRQLVQAEKLSSLGKFASCITHDLRNPLTVIRNATYFLKRKIMGEEEKIHHYLDIIEAETEAADRIVSDLLTFCRPRPLELIEIKLSELFDHLLVTFSIPSSVSVNRDFQPSLPTLSVDPDQLNRVLVNIMKNAIEAMPSGGKISIFAKEKSQGILITIADEGAGMSEEARAHLFEPFFTTKAKGIGLGLHICKSIIDQHKGTLEMESIPGQGTKFFIFLPSSLSEK